MRQNIFSILSFLSTVYGLTQDWKPFSQEVESKWHAKNFTVGEGFLHWFNKEDCRKISNCYGNNPDSPYGLAMLPKGVNEN
jgi:hypothetical protein